MAPRQIAYVMLAVSATACSSRGNGAHQQVLGAPIQGALDIVQGCVEGAVERSNGTTLWFRDCANGQSALEIGASESTGPEHDAPGNLLYLEGRLLKLSVAGDRALVTIVDQHDVQATLETVVNEAIMPWMVQSGADLRLQWRDAEGQLCHRSAHLLSSSPKWLGESTCGDVLGWASRADRAQYLVTPEMVRVELSAVSGRVVDLDVVGTQCHYYSSADHHFVSCLGEGEVINRSYSLEGVLERDERIPGRRVSVQGDRGVLIERDGSLWGHPGAECMEYTLSEGWRVLAYDMDVHTCPVLLVASDRTVEVVRMASRSPPVTRSLYFE